VGATNSKGWDSPGLTGSMWRIEELRVRKAHKLIPNESYPAG